MESKFFCVGLLVGMVGGALLVANSRKVRQAIKDGQEQIVRKAEELKEEHKCHCPETNESKK